MTGPSTTDVGIEHIALAASGAMPGRRVDSNERAVMVQQAIQALGERQRMAMMLSKFEGLCYQDIADTMGLSVKAIKSLLSRARVNLKQLLQPYIDEGNLPLRALLRDEATVELDIGSLSLNQQKSQAAEVRSE